MSQMTNNESSNRIQPLKLQSYFFGRVALKSLSTST